MTTATAPKAVTKPDDVEVPADLPPSEDLDGAREGFDDGLAWVRHRFRGITYRITELNIGSYDEIVKKATRKEKIVDPETGDSREIEMLDTTIQSRLMLKECIVEPSKVDVAKMGTRLVVALNSIVNRLHWGEEPDELKPAKKAKGDDEDEGKSGNG